MQGLHLTADLYQCRCESAWLTDPQQLGDWSVRAVEAAGLRPVDKLVHLSPDAASVAVFLGGSHIIVHTWPQQRSVAVDVYVSNGPADNTAKARGLMLALVNRFQPEWTEQRSLDRGDDS